jgi:hypothetical protein
MEKHIGYARRNKKLGDVIEINSQYVQGMLHESGKTFRWKIGLGKVELIQFGTFNPENPDYEKGGKVLKIV